MKQNEIELEEQSQSTPPNEQEQAQTSNKVKPRREDIPLPRRQETQRRTRHSEACGCHSCFHQIFLNDRNLEASRIINTIKVFCENRTPPVNHYDPPTICRCSKHLQEKIDDSEWVNKIVQEIKTKFEKPHTDGNSNPKENPPLPPEDPKQPTVQTPT